MFYVRIMFTDFKQQNPANQTKNRQFQSFTVQKLKTETLLKGDDS